MYYNIRNNELLDSCPLNGYFDDGTLVQGLDGTDFDTRKSCGILPVKSDSPQKPDDSYEDVSQRNIVVEEDGVIVTRVWISTPPNSFVPLTISARQVRLWLIDNDISLTSVEAAIDTIVNEKLREKTRVEWEFAPYIERNHPIIDTIGEFLGLTSEQIDQGFITASQL